MSSNTNLRTEPPGVDSEDANSASTKTGDEKQPPMKGSSDTSKETNYPSSESVTATVTAHPVVLPSLPEAAAAAAPTNPQSGKKPRRTVFMEQFLKKLRIMLDRESQLDSTIVQWSNDGNSFIVMDQNQFEDHTIPTYFGNPIVFASFVRKLYRWGFNRMPSRGTGRFEFCSPTFRRCDARSAVAATNTSGNSEGAASITKPVNAQAHLLQAVAQSFHPPAPNLLQNQADAVQALFSNIQRNNQQPPFPLASQPQIYGNNILQGNPEQALNLLSTALNILASDQTSSALLQRNNYQSLQTNAIIHALTSLSGMSPALPATTPQSNAAVQSLFLQMHRLGEEERQRRAQADALQSAILTAIGQLSGQGVNVIDDQERQRRAISALVQSLGINNGSNIVQNQQSIQLPADNLNFQANPVHRGDVGPVQEGTHVHHEDHSSQLDSDDESDDENDDQQDAEETEVSS